MSLSRLHPTPEAGSGRPAPLYVLRPEVNEANFAKTYGESIDGAVILGRLVADGGAPEQVEDGESAAAREPSDALARAARRSRVDHIHDPDTAVLAYLASHDDDRASRANRTRAARSVPLPLTPEDLEDRATLSRFVRATLSSQTATSLPAPPYFAFGAIDDPWLEANLACIAESQSALPDRDLAVFVRASLDGLSSGALAFAARRYAAALGPGALVILGVAGLHPGESSAEEMGAYLSAVSAFDGAGLRVLADRIDLLGPAAVAAGAVGMVGGPRIYRVIPEDPFWTQDYSVKVLLKTAMPIRGDRLKPADAVRRRDLGNAPPCPVETCRVLDRSTSNGEIREHYAHLTQHELEEAQRLGLEWVARRYEESPLKPVRRLGVAARIALERAQEA